MGNKIDLINEIYTRLNTARTSGSITEFKRVQIGSREEARKLNDLPVINMRPIRGEEKPYAQANCKVDEITIAIDLVFSTPDDSVENGMYGATNGIINSLEKVLNAIDKTTAGAVDLTFNNKGNQIPGYTYEFEYLDGVVVCTIEFKCETAQFSVGSR